MKDINWYKKMTREIRSEMDGLRKETKEIAITHPLMGVFNRALLIIDAIKQMVRVINTLKDNPKSGSNINLTDKDFGTIIHKVDYSGI